MHITHVTSAANPRLKLARSLHKRRSRRKLKQILLEGERLIADSMSAGYSPALFFFTPEAEQIHARLLQRAAADGAQLLRVEPELFSEISDTVTSQGVIAITAIPHLPVGDSGLTLMLDGVRDPGNLGTLLRSAAAANADQVLLLPGNADPWSPKVLRAGMGAHFRVAIRQVEDAFQARSSIPDHALYAADSRGDLRYTEVNWTLPSALILGGETGGSGHIHDWQDIISVAIPMARGVESLNVAVAGSIILFEAVRQRG